MRNLSHSRRKTFILAALAGICPLWVACLSDTSGDRQQSLQSLNTAVETWESQEPPHYRFRLQRSCFCPVEYRGPFLIESLRDSVVQVHRLDPLYPPSAEGTVSFDTLALTGALQTYSMDSVFTLVASFFKTESATLKLKFHPTYGYPIEATSQMPPGIEDGDITVTVTEFETVD